MSGARGYIAPVTLTEKERRQLTPGIELALQDVIRTGAKNAQIKHQFGLSDRIVNAVRHQVRAMANVRRDTSQPDTTRDGIFTGEKAVPLGHHVRCEDCGAKLTAVPCRACKIRDLAHEPPPPGLPEDGCPSCGEPKLRYIARGVYECRACQTAFDHHTHQPMEPTT